MIIDGRAIAEAVLATTSEQVKQLGSAPRLTIITCTPDLPTQKYLALKKRKAEQIGARVSVIELMDGCSTDDVCQTVAVAADQCDGLIVQLPLPAAVDTERVLATIPLSHDVDAVHYAGEGDILPPVVGAIAAIADRHDVSFRAASVAVVGAGRLVGAPALLWASQQGAAVTVLTKDTSAADTATALQAADIIITGAGVPGLLQAAQIKAGSVVFDAGTSEDGVALVGDAAGDVAEKAALSTPVPGGIGPVTVACLLQNLVRLKEQQLSERQ